MAPDSIPIIRAALVGYGKMGREIERLAEQEGFEIVARYSVDDPMGDEETDYEVAIEFSHPDAVLANLQLLAARGVPVVVGTTGWYDRLTEVEQLFAEHGGRMVYAGNFSLGVNAYLKLVREAAALWNELEMYDVALHEMHHRHKADSPSGTALVLARELLARIKRKTELLAETSHTEINPNQLHVTSQRVGAVVGTHTVLFDSEADTIELTHRAKNRSGFALGALKAARWIVKQERGVYRFEEHF